MTSRFRVCLNTIETSPESADHIIGAVVVLHNYVQKTGEKNDQDDIDDVVNDEVQIPYCDHYDDDGNLVLGDWRNEIEDHPPDFTVEAPRNRNKLRRILQDYFMLPAGFLSFQKDKVKAME